MNKLESSGATLLPIAILAAVLSGSYLWTGSTPEASKQAPKPAEVARRADDTPSTPWLSNLRPVMETMGDAMGLSLLPDVTSRTTGVTATVLNHLEAAQVTQAILTVRTELERLSNNACEPDASANPLRTEEQILNAYLLSLSDKDSDSSAEKVRSTVAEATLNELQDWRALVRLARNAEETLELGKPTYKVQFIVATVPDYVDSNSGWVADQSLAAIQSAMSRSNYLLDRFRLIDWTRSDARTDNPVASDSRVHERQPGTLIFRQQRDKEIELMVVLLALETPTGGVHRTALQNAIRFIRAWNRCTDGSESTKDLRVLGPTFSGSTLSLALTLNDPKDKFSEAFRAIRVISGSATADSNADIFRTFSRKHTTFRSAVPPTSETRRIMAAYLAKMNRIWQSGANVAILLESNTEYGRTEYGKKTDDPFERASVFSFPLHVSQLRNDALVAHGSAVTLLPTPAVPLNLRETTPPADQIPALRPQLASSVVESTVNTILDAIRHERLSAVGIQATDDRDVLFLAREVKRAVPDVQLFFLGAHSLYLHPDYVPYLRGTLVASPYSLSLATQAGFVKPSEVRREPFQSMVAEGFFNATLLLLNVDSENLLDYCDPRTQSPEPCIPSVSVSVIGEDGFWPLAGVERTQRVLSQTLEPYAQEADRKLTFGARGLPPLPNQARIVVTLLGVFVLAHVLMVLVIGRVLWQDRSVQRLLEWPVLRVLAPPVTYKSAARFHTFCLALCFIILALISTWIAAVVIPFARTASDVDPSTASPAPVSALLAGTLVLLPVVLLILMPRLIKRLPDDWPKAGRTRSSWLLLPVLPLLALAILSFGFYLVGLLKPGTVVSDLELTLARLVGGGIVSPAPATLCLFAGLYSGMFAAARRLSLVGTGYTQLEKQSPTFALLNGDPGAAARTANAQPAGAPRGMGDSGTPSGTTDGQPAQAPGGGDSNSGTASEESEVKPARTRLGDVLDMPVQNLPLPHVSAILLGILIAGFSLWDVSTIDGRAFGWFLRSTSALVLMLGLINVAQGLLIWTTARAHLKRLALTPIEGAFKRIAHLVPWDLSLAPPRLIELMLVEQRAAAIKEELGAVAGRAGGSQNRSDRSANQKNADLTSKVERFESEIQEEQHAPFIQSSRWSDLWNLADTCVEALSMNLWRRTTPQRHSDRARRRSGSPAANIVSSASETGPAKAARSTHATTTAVLEAARPAAPADNHRDALFRRCEEFVALVLAFVIRDIVARTLAALFTAMLCLTLLTAAHLLYSFNGRSSLLTLDLLAIAAASLTSILILVGMEREPILSRLRNTTPGRLDINWAFVQRVAVYGVLPLLAVLASLFPEIGNSLFGWLEPLRKLSSF